MKRITCSILQAFGFISVGLLFLGAEHRQAPEVNKTILSFEGLENAGQWIIVNDSVMGGMSKSTFKLTKNGTAVFSGVISLENNGGFASVSEQPIVRNLEDFEGIRVRVKGDGKRYNLSLKNDVFLNAFAYRFQFTTKSDQWLTVDAPFKSFVPTLMGKVVRAPPLDKSAVTSFGFLISDKQSGTFRLEIDWIGAYGGKQGDYLYIWNNMESDLVALK